MAFVSRLCVATLILATLRTTCFLEPEPGRRGSSERPAAGAEVMSPSTADETKYANNALNPENTNARLRVNISETFEVSYAQLQMARWTVYAGEEEKPFALYHSGVAFKGRDSGIQILTDFGPTITDSVSSLIFPTAGPAYDFSAYLGALGYSLGVALSWLTGRMKVTLNNEATTAIHDNWPERFTKFVPQGTITGKQFAKYLDWVRKDWAAEIRNFETIELYSGPEKRRIRDSVFCHDFVTQSYKEMKKLGAKLIEPVGTYLFRDHIMLFVDHLEEVAEPMGWADRRALMRYFRFAAIYLEQIKKEFGYVRDFLHALKIAGVTPFWFSRGKLLRIGLTDQLINYCHMMRKLPPKDVNFFETTLKVCALNETLGPLPTTPAGSPVYTPSFGELLLSWEAWADEHPFVWGVVLLCWLSILCPLLCLGRVACSIVCRSPKPKQAKDKEH